MIKVLGKFRATVNKNGYMVEMSPVGDIPEGSTFIGYFDSYREAAQQARQFCVDNDILG